MITFFETISFRQKIFTGFSILSVILIIGMGYMLLEFTYIASLGTSIIERHQPVTNVASKALKETQSASNQLHEYLLTNGAAGLDDYSSTLKNLQADINALSLFAKEDDVTIDTLHLERSATIIEEINRYTTEIVALTNNYEENHPIITSASTLLNPQALEYLGLINQIIEDAAAQEFPPEALMLLANMRHSWSQMMSHLRISLATRTTTELANVTAYVDVNREQSERFNEFGLTLDFGEIEELENIRDKYLSNLDTVIGEFNSSIWRQDANLMVTRVMPLYQELESYLDEINKIQLINSKTASTDLAKELSKATQVFMALIAISLIVAFIISSFITRSLHRPLKKLVTANESVAMGNLDTTIDVSGHDEINLLNKSFNDMVSNLRQSQKNLQTALVESKYASEAKTRFLSSMSHELRNPLNAILGFSQLLELEIKKQQAAGLDNAAHLKLVGKIRNSGHHLLDLINDILDLSHIEEGRLNLKLEMVNVHATVLECISQIEAGMSTKLNIELIDHTDGLVANVLADHLRLRQILMNLMSNAVKYNRDGGSVTINGSLNADDMLRISVTDTGSGITEQDIDKLFTPFERLKFSHGNVEGTGIGLTITRQLIEAMGGSIGVSSTIGEGSTFWVELPVYTNAK